MGSSKRIGELDLITEPTIPIKRRKIDSEYSTNPYTIKERKRQEKRSKDSLTNEHELNRGKLNTKICRLFAKHKNTDEFLALSPDAQKLRKRW
ncbi:hypothetical protein LTR62_007263 [Meristemomyces frigidus]|uniref:Uncharacterized protein n=1 Tax=Meristemomyces frigidus TaxID=1508187 RepID=A0AAN7TAS5_9PEZI|nr:hypothetical protein LTR62_007263 [Meristemomyces frigidus]